MTKIQNTDIRCKCGNLVETKLYHSVNVMLNPELKKNILNREINNFYCKKCGLKSDLICQFLYVDDNYKEWIWCFPEGLKQKKDKILEEIKNDRATEILDSFNLGISQSVVFGYDELLKKIDIYDSNIII